MKRKFLTRLLSLVMVLSLMPVGAFAAEDEPETEPESEEVTALGTSGESEEGNTPGTLGALVGEVQPITSTGNVVNIETGKDKVTVTPVAPIPWSQANPTIGRTADGCWIGIDIIAPNKDIDPKKVKFRNYTNIEDRKWSDADDGTREDGRYHMGAWGLATPKMFNDAGGKDLVYTWYFNWDDNTETGVTIPIEDFKEPTGKPIEHPKGASDMEGVDQIITLTFNPYAVTLWDEDNNIVWPLSDVPKVVLRKGDIKLAPLTGGDADNLKGGNCTTYSMESLTQDPAIYTRPIDIVLRADNLRKHVNGAGVEGYWAGFAVTLPDDLKGAYATGSDSIKVRAIFSDKEENTTAEKLKDVTPDSLELNVDGAGNPGYTFYTDVGAEKQKKYAILQFVNRDNIPLTKEYRFNINTDDVHPVAYDISVKLSEGGENQIKFAEDKDSYVVNAGKDDEAIILTTDKDAIVKVNGKESSARIIALQAGVNTIEVSIGSQAGRKTYTIKVVKPSKNIDADTAAQEKSNTASNPAATTNSTASAVISTDEALKAITYVDTENPQINTAVFDTVANPNKMYYFDSVNVTLPALVSESLLDRNVPAKIVTDLIDVTLTPEAIKAALPSDGVNPVPQDLKLVIEKADVSDLPEGLRERAVAVDVSLKDKDEKTVKVIGLSADGSIKLTFPIPDELAPFAETMHIAWYDPEKKEYKEIPAIGDMTKGCYIAETTHLSKFVMYADPVGEQLKIKIAGEEQNIQFWNRAATFNIGSVQQIAFELPSGATALEWSGCSYSSQNGMLTIIGSGNTQAVIRFQKGGKTYTLTLERPSAQPDDLKVTWERVERNYDYYGGILTIDHLDPYKTYLVTFDNSLAVKSGKDMVVPRITTVVKGRSKITLSCQEDMKVIVWKLPDKQPTDYAEWKEEDVVFCNRNAFNMAADKINENLGIRADRIPYMR